MSPILDLQQRIRELGRIRIGQVVPTAGGKTRPSKLDRFRLTSPSKELLEKVAARYGGTVAPWTPANGGPSQFEVLTDARRMPILVPHQPVSQYLELWSGGGCQRRCDSVTELLSDRPCLCGPDPQRRECKPTTRLNVVLSEVKALGVWRLESHGYYAALELPGVAELLARAGGYVAAHLGLEERTAKRDGMTLRWMVPTIDVDVTPAELMAGRGPAAAAVAGAPAARAAIEAPRPDYAALAAVAKTADEVGALWKQAVHAGHMDDRLAAALNARGEALKAAAPPPAPSPAAPPPPVSEVVDAEIVDDAELHELWFQILAAAGVRGWTTTQTEAAFAREHGGLHPSSASAEQLRAFAATVKDGAA
jgi:hypothetical protein